MEVEVARVEAEVCVAFVEVEYRLVRLGIVWVVMRGVVHIDRLWGRWFLHIVWVVR